MSEHRHRPRKRFGQHFLHDPQVLQRMLQAIQPRAGDRLVEIGPGEGALSIPLLQAHGELIAVELDRDLLLPLRQKCEPLGRFELHNADALKFDFATLAQMDQKLRIVGNLPYNISTPLLFHLANYAACIQDLHVLIQKEVADRITAAPGGKNYGRLSVMMQYIFQTEPLFGVPPGAFRPPPQVHSSFIRLIPHARPPVDIKQPESLSQIVTSAFSQRRKTLRNCLKGLLSAEQIKAAGINPATRAETLSLAEFAALANALPDEASGGPT